FRPPEGHGGARGGEPVSGMTRQPDGEGEMTMEKLLVYVPREVEAEKVAPGIYLHPTVYARPSDDQRGWTVSHESGAAMCNHEDKEVARAAALALAGLRDWSGL